MTDDVSELGGAAEVVGGAAEVAGGSGLLITEWVRRHARATPEKAAVIEVGVGGDGRVERGVAAGRAGASEVGAGGAGRAVSRQLTFAELDAEADNWAQRLLALGVVPGEPVAYQLPNLLAFVSLSLGALRIGAVCEPLMPIFRERELEFMLGQSAARVLVVPERWRGHDHVAMARGLVVRLETLEHVVVLDAGGGCGDRAQRGTIARESASASVSRSAGAVRGSDDRPAPTLTPEMTAQLLFTSGSTGEPKGVLQNHASLNTAAQIHARHFGLTTDDVIYAPSPLAHQTGFLYGMWIALTLGATQVIQTHWDAEVSFQAITEHGVTFVQAATPFLADLVRVASEQDRRPESLRIFVAAGAAIPRELARDARAVLGAEVGGAFGTTESCLGAAFVPGIEDERAWRTDGRNLEGITLRVTDDAGNVLPPGEEGNFEVLTPTLFEGYLNRPELTAEAVTPDGYYRTGDLARIDQDGYLKITGRVKDVINRGGEKVPVVEVEQVLYLHPAVREVAIVAMPDPRLGERACAFIVLEPEGGLDFEQMQRHLDAHRVAKPYWPERLELVSELPHTPSGKIQKFMLRSRVEELTQSEVVPR